MQKFKQFIVSAKPFEADILSGLLWKFDITGITENDLSLTVFAKENSTLTVEKLNSFLTDLKSQEIISKFEIQFNIFEDKNWNEEWEKKTEVIEVTDRIVIKPTFRDYKNTSDKIVVQINPKMSFGTGKHQTTRLMLQLLQKYIKPNLQILDVGTGTGILAIAAAKLTSTKSILGIDNDEWCVLNSTENISLNKLETRIEIKLAEISQISETDFDLITANINKNILTQIAGKLYEKLKTSGTLILSGIFEKDISQVETFFYKTGFRKIEHQSIDEWAALVLQKTI